MKACYTSNHNNGDDDNIDFETMITSMTTILSVVAAQPGYVLCQLWLSRVGCSEGYTQGYNAPSAGEAIL